MVDILIPWFSGIAIYIIDDLMYEHNIFESLFSIRGRWDNLSVFLDD